MILAIDCDPARRGLCGRAIRGTRTADLVIRHARVITLDAANHVTQAVAIRGDRIMAVGADDEIQPLIGPATKIIEAAGKSLLPGLYDSHVHPLGRGSQRGRSSHSCFRVAGRREVVYCRPCQDPAEGIPGSSPAMPFRPGWRKAASSPGPSSTGSRRSTWSCTKEGRPELSTRKPWLTPGSRGIPQSARRANRQGPPHRRADGNDSQRLLGPQGSSLRRLWRRGHPGRRASETAVREIQRTRAHQHWRPRSQRGGPETLPRFARSRRTDSTDQRHANTEPALWRSVRDHCEAQRTGRLRESGRAERPHAASAITGCGSAR